MPAVATSITQTEMQPWESRWYAAQYLMQTTVSANSAPCGHWLVPASQVALGVRRERIPPCIDQFTMCAQCSAVCNPDSVLTMMHAR